MEFPPELKYTENDEWVRVEGETATVGITDYAQDQLSDVVYVEISAALDETYKKGDVLGTIESVKAAADVYLPVSGTVTAINEGLSDVPELINADPYGEAWMIRLTVSEPAELESLMDATAYAKHCKARGG